MRCLRVMLAVAAVLAVLGGTAGCKSDWTCPGCPHDANIRVEDALQYEGKRAHVRIVSAGGRTASASFVLSGDETDYTFSDFIREGGGPYDTRTFVDMDGDGRCDEAGDPAWRETFDDDETLWVVDMGDAQSNCD